MDHPSEEKREGEWKRTEEEWTKRVSEDLEGAPKRLADTASKHLLLRNGREVHVEAFLPEVAVVIEVVLSEVKREGEDERQVCHHRKDSVVERRGEEEVVSHLVYGEEEGLRHSPTHEVEEEEVASPTQVGGDDPSPQLEDYEKDGYVLAPPLVTT